MPHPFTIAQPRVTLEDPHACTDSADVLTVFGAIFDTLIRRDGHGGYTPDRVAYANRVRQKRVGDLCVFDSSPMSTFRVLVEKIDSRFAGSWWQGYRNPAAETLIDTARTTTSPAARAALYRHIYRLLQADPPWLTLYNHTRVIALAGDHPGFTMPDDGVLDVRRLKG